MASDAVGETTEGKSPARVAARLLRVLLGVVFVVSAVAKLVAIDSFELYIFSYGFVPLNVTFVLARLCIAGEALLAVMIVTGWWRRWVNLAVLAVLLLFSVFLCYAALSGRDDSCQCMGRLADMPPAVSLLKNAALIVATLFVMKLERGGEESRWPAARKVVVTLAVAVGLTVAVFTISVPDSWMFGEEEMLYDKELLQETVKERGLDDGHKLVAFVTPGCPYCKMSREKIGMIAKRHDLDTTAIVYIEPADIGAQRFMDLTYGSRPLVVLVADGTPVGTCHYRNIDERNLAGFLPKQ